MALDDEPGGRRLVRLAAGAFGALVLLLALLMLYWDHEPELFDVLESASAREADPGDAQVVGYVTVATLSRVASTLLDKRGGYLSNDVAPPGLLMDNVPNWEFGVLVQVRDLAKALRNDYSRSQTQSTEDPDLIVAEPQFNFDSESWILPATEREYRKAIEAVESYQARLAGGEAQFFARADNLRDWLAVVEKRLGSLSQRLSASVGQLRVNTDLGGDDGAGVDPASPSDETLVKTPRRQVDDVFYEARGATWALVQFLRAAEHDFAAVLEKKNALVSLRQIIRELEATQDPIWSPVILNGSGFGLLANHSLVMASYISRANAAVIDLGQLLAQG